jgi:hypothetical protein
MTPEPIKQAKRNGGARAEFIAEMRDIRRSHYIEGVSVYHCMARLAAAIDRLDSRAPQRQGGKK